jgi:hypothetical protein
LMYLRGRAPVSFWNNMLCLLKFLVNWYVWKCKSRFCFLVTCNLFL